MSIYEKGSTNIWEVVVIVVFCSVLFIVGMYIWTLYSVQAKQTELMPSLPKTVTDEFASFQLRYDQTVLAKCQLDQEVVYSVLGRSESRGQIMTFEEGGVILTAGTFSKINDSAYKKLTAGLDGEDCEVINSISH